MLATRQRQLILRVTVQRNSARNATNDRYCAERHGQFVASEAQGTCGHAQRYVPGPRGNYGQNGKGTGLAKAMTHRSKILSGVILVICLVIGAVLFRSMWDRISASAIEARFRGGVTLEGLYRGRFDNSYFYRVLIILEDGVVREDGDNGLSVNWGEKSIVLSSVSPNDLASWGAKVDSNESNTWHVRVRDDAGRDGFFLDFVFSSGRLARFMLIGTRAAKGPISISVGESGQRVLIPCSGNEAVEVFGEPIETILHSRD